MSFLTTIIGLAELADAFYSLWQRLKGQDAKSLCLWLGACGQVLDQISQQLHAGVYPHSQCGHLQYLFENSVECADRHLTYAERESFYGLIGEACRVELLFGELQSLPPEDRKRQLQEFDTLCGKFNGFLDLCRSTRPAP